MSQQLPGLGHLEAHVLGEHPPLRCLSYWQPWASLHVAGFKLHETRGYPTKVRGAVALHASKTLVRQVEPQLDLLCTLAFGADWREPGVLPLGCVVAVADLTGCYRADHLAEGRPPLLPAIRECDWLSGNYADGRWGWRMDRVRALREPLPLKGKQGWFQWRPPADLAARLGPAPKHAAQADRWDAAQVAVARRR